VGKWACAFARNTCTSSSNNIIIHHFTLLFNGKLEKKRIFFQSKSKPLNKTKYRHEKTKFVNLKAKKTTIEKRKNGRIPCLAVYSFGLWQKYRK